MGKEVIVPLANGLEEIEAVGIIDILRRAKIKVIPAAIKSKKVKASRGVTLLADVYWKDIKDRIFDGIILPGGYRGTQTLLNTPSIIAAVKKHFYNGSLVAAICAAPLVLQKAEIINSRKITCHPAVVQELSSVKYLNKKVVKDENIITAQGPGVVFDFSLALVEVLTDKKIAQQIAREIII